MKDLLKTENSFVGCLSLALSQQIHLQDFLNDNSASVWYHLRHNGRIKSFQHTIFYK